jgi:hypothetical protein
LGFVDYWIGGGAAFQQSNHPLITNPIGMVAIPSAALGRAGL